MIHDQLEKGKEYNCTSSINACAWDVNQCAMGDQLDVMSGDKLTFVEEADNDNFIFIRDNATICLHANDLGALEVA